MRLKVKLGRAVIFPVPILRVEDQAGDGRREVTRSGRVSRTRANRAVRTLWLVFICGLRLGLCDGISGEVRAERWRWSNPLPHGNNVMDMLYTEAFTVQVGDAGALYVRREDGRWTPAVTGVTNYLRGVAMLGTRIVAVGETGCIIWSDDGNYFQPAELSPPTTDWFEGVAASAQRAVAVGDNGAIYTSTNGVNWTRVNSGTTQWLRGVAFGNGTFVAVGENGTILRSLGGVSWTPVASGTTAHLNRVRYIGTGPSGRFAAVGNGGVALSSSTGSAPWAALNSGTTNHLYDVAAMTQVCC